MIYWFTGQPAHGKTVLGKKLHSFLKTQKRNWRKDVFHLDGDDLRELTINKDYSQKVFDGLFFLTSLLQRTKNIKINKGWMNTNITIFASSYPMPVTFPINSRT